MRLLALLCGLFISIALLGQDKSPYVIYNSKGKKVSYKRMLRDVSRSQLVFFGEQHSNAIAHWLEYELAYDLSQMSTLTMGAEMIEADNQVGLNQYLAGEIASGDLDTVIRLWSNHSTDYAPLIDFAKENGLEFIATNIPRRFASQVYKRSGFETLDSLTAQEKTWLAPLPIAFNPNLKTYKEILVMMGNHGTPALVMAQATKDATMAHFISENLDSEGVFLHFNGSYHSDFYEGIIWHLLKVNPDVKISTISTVEQPNIRKLEKEHYGRADFIICVDENMTHTY